MRQVWIVLCAALCWGCFVFDELDHGQEVMKQLGPGDHGTAKPAAEAAPSRAAEPEGPGVLERLEAWWDEATAPEPVGPDPDDEIVACRVDGSTHFMRESDCQLRGGRAG
jgi:hypothetical protein